MRTLGDIITTNPSQHLSAISEIVKKVSCHSSAINNLLDHHTHTLSLHSSHESHQARLPSLHFHAHNRCPLAHSAAPHPFRTAARLYARLVPRGSSQLRLAWKSRAHSCECDFLADIVAETETVCAAVETMSVGTETESWIMIETESLLSGQFEFETF